MMKKILTLVCLALTTLSNAQFINSNIPESSITQSAQTAAISTNTANDLRSTILGGWTHAIAWSGNSPGFYYYALGTSYSSYFPLPLGTTTVDVAICVGSPSSNVIQSTKILVVFVRGGLCYLNQYDLTSSYTFNVTTKPIPTGINNNSYARIDIDYNGNWVIVAGGTSAMKIYKGNANSLNTGTFYTGATSMPGLVSPNYYGDADVCLSSNGSSPYNITLSYLQSDINNTHLLTRNMSFTNFTVNYSNLLQSVSNASGNTIYRPRIACYRVNTVLNQEMYTVAYIAPGVGALYQARVYNYRNGASSFTNTSGGTAPGFPTTLLDPKVESVTYLDLSGQYCISMSLGFMSHSLVGLKINNNGSNPATLYGQPVPANPRYFDIHNPFRPNCSLSSLAGKNAMDRRFGVSYFDQTNNRVYYKIVDGNAPNTMIGMLDEGSPIEVPTVEKKIEVFPVPSSRFIDIHMYGYNESETLSAIVSDITGKIIFRSHGSYQPLIENIKQWFPNAGSGRYFLTITDGIHPNTVNMIKE